MTLSKFPYLQAIFWNASSKALDVSLFSPSVRFICSRKSLFVLLYFSFSKLLSASCLRMSVSSFLRFSTVFSAERNELRYYRFLFIFFRFSFDNSERIASYFLSIFDWFPEVGSVWNRSCLREDGFAI